MYAYTADQLAEVAEGIWHAADQLDRVGRFCFDARQIQAGECFVALSGGVRDGHEFIEQAAQGGAACAIVERVVDVALPQLLVKDSLLALGAVGSAARDRFTAPVVGITGSCGKTSTKEMLRLLLGERVTHATAGNWNNRIGVPMTLNDLDPANHQFAVIEAGINQPGEMQLLGEMIYGDLTIVTNVGPAHLELLETVENVAVEKARLAQAAREGSPVVIPSDLLKYSVFQAMAERAVVLRRCEEVMPDMEVYKRIDYTLKAHGDGNAHKLTLFSVKSAYGFTVHTPSCGIATNAALAIAAALELGVSIELIQERIQNWRPAANRGRMLQLGEQFFYVDCYNANPASMVDALLAFESISDKTLPRVYVLGAMNELGEDAEDQHTAIGKSLNLRTEDRAIFIGPKQLTTAYQAGALAAGYGADQLQCGESIEKIKSDIAEVRGSIFLKGSRSYQLEKLLSEATTTH